MPAKQKSQSKNQELIEAVKQNPVLLDKMLESPEIRAIMVQRTHSGPLPPAEDIAMYNNNIPNGGDRIMVMAEKAQDYAFQSKQQEFHIQKTGQWLAICVVVLFSALATYIAYLGDTKIAALLMGAGLASIVTAFLYANKKK